MRETGRLARWTAGNYGYIRPDGPGAADLFVHGSVLPGGEALLGVAIQFERGLDPKGRPCASWACPVRAEESPRITAARRT